MKFEKSILLTIGILFSSPVALNLWKFIARDYTILELLPQILLDFSVVGLFIFLLTSRPLEKPFIYWPLFIWFCAVFLFQQTPDSIASWIATIFVLGIFGFYIFPNVAYHVMPYILTGLFISYFLVLRFMLFNMNYSEAQEILNKKNQAETAKEFIHILAGYERNMIGSEKYRFFLYKDSEFSKRLSASKDLHDQIFPSLNSQKISFLEWGKAYAKESNFIVEISSMGLTGISTEKDAQDFPIPCMAKVEPFNIKMIQLEDGSYRILELPEKITVSRVDLQ